MAQGALGAADSIRGLLRSVQNSPGSPRERSKRPGGTLGVFETARGRLGSVRNGPGAPH